MNDTQINDGGPFHPIQVMDFQPTSGEQVVRETFPGISIRAHIAGQAMTAIITSFGAGCPHPLDQTKNRDGVESTVGKDWSDAACIWADFMIAALEAKQ